MLPKTAYIQAESQFSIQLKFLPRKSLLEDAGSYFDKETGLLEVPITLRVADQVMICFKYFAGIFSELTHIFVMC